MPIAKRLGLSQTQHRLVTVGTGGHVLASRLESLTNILALARVSVHVAVAVSVLLILEADGLLEAVSDTVELESLDTLVVVGDTESLAELFSDGRVHLVEDGELLLENLWLSAGAHVTGQVVNHAVLSAWLASIHLVPHFSGLVEIDTGDGTYKKSKLLLPVNGIKDRRLTAGAR